MLLAWSDEVLNNEVLCKSEFSDFFIWNATRETIYVPTIAVIHYFSSRASLSVFDSKYIKITGLQDFYWAISFTDTFKKQPPEVFCKKNVFLKICENSQKTLVLEFLFNKVTFRPATLLNSDSNIDVFLWNLRNF